ncbi:hypothetical protein LSCM1_07536 [Leishmania martiniquensis]|uniref:Transmembrane protein n=1 Tax=Leishmania martiniquensis TaxID=1580590 RepID=A0A836KTU7_9TRYP|nr:hypothetical protein LSCM1_07536 [Leishmania martiniquensis]
MSRHFTGRAEAERTTGLAYLLSPTRTVSPGELRFRRHAYARGACMIVMVLYFVYCNPEYSYVYTALRQRCGWDMEKSMFPQYLKLEPSQAPGALSASEGPRQHAQQPIPPRSPF